MCETVQNTISLLIIVFEGKYIELHFDFSNFKLSTIICLIVLAFDLRGEIHSIFFYNIVGAGRKRIMREARRREIDLFTGWYRFTVDVYYLLSYIIRGIQGLKLGDGYERGLSFLAPSQRFQSVPFNISSKSLHWNAQLFVKNIETFLELE